jgi:tetratricopeptide (TPR) repeat protein
MAVRWVRSAALLIGLFTGAAGRAAYAQSDEIAALNWRIIELDRAGKYSEAIPLAEKSLKLTRDQKGNDHLETSMRMNSLASLYDKQGRYIEAEPLYKRSISIRETLLGPDHPDIGTWLSNLADLAPKGAWPRPSRFSSAAFQPRRRRWGPITAMLAPRSTIWPCSTVTRAATPKPSRSTSATSL